MGARNLGTTSETPSRPGVSGSKSQPSKEDSHNFANLIGQTTDPAVITLDGGKAQKKVLADVARVNEANRKKRGPEAGWRDELATLERTVGNSWTEEQARQNSDATERAQNEIVRGIEKEIAELRELQSTPYLGPAEKQALAKNLERAEWNLAEAKVEKQRKIRQAGSAVTSSKERDRLRPRLRELREREMRISAATAKVREATDGGATSGRLGFTGLQPLSEK
ncbi:hypothetical protein SBA1_100070 [Candidatus Sulfotelmatobacter kueseliae]|uniref:Uncharacterized protein n=1 Tax=Candidatus Sulfotelmatobacter kueseliae TaxID=2042962 RepID=A0A2U3JW27_9BACT|nr:hypothetical protein SBA1_100070 [Candidatus Sulfotelmatobacter kueseliae]